MTGAARRVHNGGMSLPDRESLRRIVHDVTAWSAEAREVVRERTAVAAARDGAAATLSGRVVEVRNGERTAWRLLPLRPEDAPLLQALEDWNRMVPLDEAQRAAVESLLQGPDEDAAAVAPLLSWRRVLLGSRRRAEAEEAAQRLAVFHHEGVRSGLAAMLEHIRPVRVSVPDGHALTEAAADGRLRLHEHVDGVGPAAALLAAADLPGLAEDGMRVEHAVRTEAERRRLVLAAGDKVVYNLARARLQQMPVEVLRDATEGRIPVQRLRDAGVDTAWQAFVRREELQRYPGIGAVMAERSAAAALGLHGQVRDEVSVVLDPAHEDAGPHGPLTELVHRLRAWEPVRPVRHRAQQLALAAALSPAARALHEGATHLVVSAGDMTAAQFREGVRQVHEFADGLLDPDRPVGEAADAWADVAARPAVFAALLEELELVAADSRRAEGMLPEDVVEAVRAQPLDRSALAEHTSLRGYQDFAARFVLVQSRVLIGDEMGLGKTVEALAALAHLWAQGVRRMLVVCPAAVVPNWMREIERHTQVPAHRLHGPARSAGLAAWRREGGIAVTSFGSLGAVLGDGDAPGRRAEAAAALAPQVLVADEAHYAKNTAAKRTARVRALAEHADHVVLLTGTPLLNRVEEFRSLLGVLDQDLERATAGLSGTAFREAVAPRYLRRNQEDVLVELPEAIEMEDLVPFSRADEENYRQAVAEGTFMRVRQAAFAAGNDSAKVERLREICEGAAASGQRVLVFSAFLDVLEVCRRELERDGTAVHGPITGAVSPDARQRTVDAFGDAPAGAVLLAQTEAGGVGLNIQAASVVVLCEPQLTPAAEDQAVARAHRMGQLHRVQVHRLVSEEGVDQMLVQRLDAKRVVFDELARESSLRDAAPEAVDITDSELARQVLAAERERLGLA